MSVRLVGVAILAVALGACATRPVSPALPRIDSPAAYQATRAARLATQPDWSMTGRVAVSSGKEGGSARIEWRQAGPRFDVTLSAPVTRRSWRVTGGDGAAMLEGMDGGPRTGPDAGQLVFAATRWDIPIDALQAWVRGVPEHDGARLAYGPDGRLSRIEEGGWTVDYAAWQAADFDPGVALPARIEATRGEAKVRLVVDAWTSDAAPQ